VMVCRDRVSVSQLMQNPQLTHRTVRTPDFPDFWVLGGLPQSRRYATEQLSTRLARSRLSGKPHAVDHRW
jgi:hypothetical protein